MELFEHAFSDIRNYIEGRNCRFWITAEQKMSGLWVAVETWFYRMKWRWNWEALK